jgi:hypothetical protein
MAGYTGTYERAFGSRIAAARCAFAHTRTLGDAPGAMSAGCACTSFIAGDAGLLGGAPARAERVARPPRRRWAMSQPGLLSGAPARGLNASAGHRAGGAR